MVAHELRFRYIEFKVLTGNRHRHVSQTTGCISLKPRKEITAKAISQDSRRPSKEAM